MKLSHLLTTVCLFLRMLGLQTKCYDLPKIAMYAGSFYMSFAVLLCSIVSQSHVQSTLSLSCCLRASISATHPGGPEVMTWEPHPRDIEAIKKMYEEGSSGVLNRTIMAGAS